ncbi:TetR family transcriptional regulator [Pseudolabrys taiwanensis]|uniref:TetR family transcriptional regulator n=1 Tax=Pseudolabrys taiwanensis TaxID=331696 RepID=A0A345ZXW4_9HYPH|nr:TetR/AcrR family transcriptional regulator [Pseudolabrys taiwanensis]AXK81761.1 TetR family transcriptional regulator [Pseudolabrys taiwanensis]
MAVAATPKAKRAGAAKSKARLEPVRDAERTQQAILAAAEAEFASKGLAGARVDVIAEQAGANKRMMYYYFGSKDDLYLAVLERAYGAMREKERDLNLADLDPLEAIKTLVHFKFDYYVEHQSIISLLAGENLSGATFLKRSRKLRDMQTSLVGVIQRVLAAGEAKGVIRKGLDPLHLYLSISALGYFYFSNAATLSVAFGRQLLSAPERNERRQHCVDVIMSYVTAR